MPAHSTTFQQNFNPNPNIFIQENAFENVSKRLNLFYDLDDKYISG